MLEMNSGFRSRRFIVGRRRFEFEHGIYGIRFIQERQNVFNMIMPIHPTMKRMQPINLKEAEKLLPAVKSSQMNVNIHMQNDSTS
jgi:hypothetical protein